MGPTNLVWYRSKTLAMVAISSTALMLGAPSAYAAPTVITAQGTLRGLVAETAEAFFAVPYATPPLGILRFQPSQPPQPYPVGCAMLRLSRRLVTRQEQRQQQRRHRARTACISICGGLPAHCLTRNCPCSSTSTVADSG